MSRAVLALLLVGVASPALADDTAPTPFDRGKFGIGLYGGSQTALGHHYFGVGANVGYYVLDGVEIALGGVEQFGDGPNIAVITPSLRYVVQPLVGKSPVIPYVGAFYNHWFISGGIADEDTLGGRAGLLYVSGHLILGLGVAYEHVISECAGDCSSVYPDISIALSL
jgi:hypothetical protein